LIEGYRLAIPKSFKAHNQDPKSKLSYLDLTRNYSTDSFLQSNDIVNDYDPKIHSHNDIEEMLTKDLLSKSKNRIIKDEIFNEKNEKFVTLSVSPTDNDKSLLKRNSIGPDILNRKTDQVENRGYLNKYSIIIFLST
jgi:hypothetical protein